LTGQEANRYSHELRARVQAIIVGTQTVMNDDPQLTVRHADVPVSGQPLRVVVGERTLPTDARIFDSSGPSLQVREHDPSAVLAALYAGGNRHVLLEGGPTLLRAFVERGLVDELVWLVAGVWLGGGPRALPEGSRLGSHAAVVESAALGQDVLMRLIPMGQAV
jgi:diaminohydroxyphosphoribosylaminopyrimidine deaminase/5-amino-6-(5-phosphoribosylamino)uracil reductase